MNPQIKQAVERGDITTTAYRPEGAVGRYQGNGRFGCVYSRLGLNAHPDEREAYDAHGFTQFMHLGHWGRFQFHSDYMQADTSADYLLPLARLHWEIQPAEISDYRQSQSFYDGTLRTEFTSERKNRVALTTWFDPTQRNLSGLSLEVQGQVSPIILAPVASFQPYPYGYKQTARQDFTIQRSGENWVIEITCATAIPPAVSRIFVYAAAGTEPCAAGLRIFPATGRSSVFFSYGEPCEPAEAALSLTKTTAHWHSVWEKSAWFDFPEQNSQRMWVRSLAYILSSFNDDGCGFTSTNGLTGNIFPFNFAQDLFYVHPVLLAAGHTAIAQSWIEQFARQIDGMKAYARRLWPEVEGIYPPWELPYGPITGYHEPSVPIFYCYEPHNAGYLSRMAHETAVMAHDPAWSAAHAVPLIREIARFYRSFCRKEADGYWHLFLAPSVGQDEAGGRNQKDYLCALYSAQYSFQQAVAYGLDADGAYQEILSDGLAFPVLLSERGFFYASAGAGPQDFGRQKHPVQLNGLAYLPVSPEPRPEERAAYALRYATTKSAGEPHFFGWTLGEFLLAGSHLGEAAGWRQDWENIRPSDYTDPDWVQFYETSRTTRQSFYVTTHGLVAQSLCDNIVCDYWGRLTVAACPVYREPVRFGNFRSRLGVTVSGEVNGANATVSLRAWKDCSLKVNGTALTLTAGETETLALDLSLAQPHPLPLSNPTHFSP